MDNKLTTITIAADGSGYSSHIPFLQFIFKKFDPCSVVEFGMGLYSTPFFLVNCCNVVSIEMQDIVWYDKVTQKLGQNQNWKTYLALGPDTWKQIALPEKFCLAFVDGHIDSRTDCVNAMFNRQIPYIVAHDTECNVYHWQKIKQPNNYRKLIFDNKGSQTTLWVREDKF